MDFINFYILSDIIELKNPLKMHKFSFENNQESSGLVVKALFNVEVPGSNTSWF